MKANKEILCKYCFSTESCCTDIEAETCENLERLDEEISTRQRAISWWKLIDYNTRYDITNKYLASEELGTVDPTSLTEEEIEQIYDKEVLEPKRQEEWQESQINRRYSKPNQKQFKEFSPELFQKYIDKFSDEDKVAALRVLFKSIGITSKDKLEYFLAKY